MPASITINAEQFVHELQGVARDQFPFGLANALTKTAQDIVTEGIAELPQHFTIRRPWVSKGFHVEFARKTHLVAEIGHKDEFMIRQELGGEKTPTTAQSVAIPKGARPNPQAVTTPSKWPGHLARHFYVTSGGKTLEFVRTGRRGHHHKHAKAGSGQHRGAGERDVNVKLMYILKPSIIVPARWHFRDLALKVAGERFAQNFAQALEHAIETAR